MADDKDNRGLFGYEGEGYMRGAAEEVEQDYEEHELSRRARKSAPKPEQPEPAADERSEQEK